MSKNDDTTVTLASIIPEDRKWLLDDDTKVGATISFTGAELKELSKLVDSRAWEVLKKVYVKQRLVQISTANINASQTADELMFYKGKAAESNHLIQVVEAEVRKARIAEEEKNKQSKVN